MPKEPIRNLPNRTTHNKGFNQHLLNDPTELKTFQRFIEANGKLMGFQEFLKEWLFRYFQIHWKIHKHLNNFYEEGRKGERQDHAGKGEAETRAAYAAAVWPREEQREGEEAGEPNPFPGRMPYGKETTF